MQPSAHTRGGMQPSAQHTGAAALTLEQVLEVNAADMDCRVQAGVSRQQLNAELHETGTFALQPLTRGAQHWLPPPSGAPNLTPE